MIEDTIAESPCCSRNWRPSDDGADGDTVVAASCRACRAARTAEEVSKNEDPWTGFNEPVSTSCWTTARGTPAARAISPIVNTSTCDSMDVEPLKANPLPPVGPAIQPDTRCASQVD